MSLRINAGSILVFFVTCLLCISGPVASLYADSGVKSAYLRIGSGLSLSHNTEFLDRDCNASDPAALFGCSPGNDGRTIAAYGDFDDTLLLEISLGYRWNEWLRTEFALGYRPDFEFEGHSNFNQINTDFTQQVAGDLSSLSGLMTVFVEPLALFTDNEWMIKPFLVAGIGLAHNRMDPMTYTFPSTATFTPDGDHTDFAWAIGAGCGYALTEHVGIELLYRYVNLGEVRTGVDNLTIIRRSSGAIITNAITIDETRSDLEVSEVLLSLIWYF